MRATSLMALRVVSVALTLTSSSSRNRLLPSSRQNTVFVSSSLKVWLNIWSITCASPRTEMVIREISGSFVADTVRESMLKPRLANKLETRASTPEWLYTNTDNTLFVIVSPPQSMMISSIVCPGGIIGSTFSSLSMGHSIQQGRLLASASLSACSNSFRFVTR